MNATIDVELFPADNWHRPTVDLNTDPFPSEVREFGVNYSDGHIGSVRCLTVCAFDSIFFRISVLGVSLTSWGYKISGRHDWS